MPEATGRGRERRDFEVENSQKFSPTRDRQRSHLLSLSRKVTVPDRWTWLHDVTPVPIKKSPRRGRSGGTHCRGRDRGISPGIYRPRLHPRLRNDPIRCTGLFECKTCAGRISELSLPRFSVARTSIYKRSHDKRNEESRDPQGTLRKSDEQDIRLENCGSSW